MTDIDPATPIIPHLIERIEALEERVRNLEPETEEWEYAHRYARGDGTHYLAPVSKATALRQEPTGIRADGSPYWDYTTVRRRKAGEWHLVPNEEEGGRIVNSLYYGSGNFDLTRIHEAQILREAADQMRSCKEPGHWNLRDPRDPERAYSPDVWLEVMASRIEAGEDE